MHDLSLMAATEWARAHAPMHRGDPVAFGRKVALVYCACSKTQYHAGDEKATAAALAALSIAPEVLQAIALLASLHLGRTEADLRQKDSAGAES